MLPIGQNAKFLCQLNRKIPELLVNHLLFVFGPFASGVIVNKTLESKWWGYLVVPVNPKNVECHSLNIKYEKIVEIATICSEQ